MNRRVTARLSALVAVALAGACSSTSAPTVGSDADAGALEQLPDSSTDGPGTSDAGRQVDTAIDASPADGATDGGPADAGEDAAPSDAGANDASPDAGPPLPPLSPALQAACEQLAAAQCNKLDACDHARMRGQFGDLPGCVERHVIACGLDKGATGSTYSPQDVHDCAAALAASPRCTYFYDLPAECRKPGARALGSSCGADEQCASGLCDRQSHQSECGVCRTAGVQGGACLHGVTSAESRCAAGFACHSTCTAVVPAGGSCASSPVCERGYVCGPANICAKRSAIGDACVATPANDPCLGSGTGYCGGGGVCVANQFNAPPSSCQGQGMKCAKSYCISYSCKPLGADNSTTGMYCQPPARLRSSGSGCHFAIPSKC